MASRCEFPYDIRVIRSKAVFECFNGISSLASYLCVPFDVSIFLSLPISSEMG